MSPELTVVGVDYSLTSPGLCVYTGDLKSTPSFPKSHHYFRNKTKRHDDYHTSNIHGSNHAAYRCEQERHSNLANWAMNIISKHKVDRVFIEGYSYGSSGKVFNIAENTGILKDRLWKWGIPFHTVAPSAVKKFASGKGNANKDKMYEALLSECSVDLAGLLTPKASKIISPVADIVDAYYIMRWGWASLD